MVLVADTAIAMFEKLRSGVTPIVVLGGLLLAALVLMSNATEDSARFGELYSLLLLVNAAGLVILAGLIGWHLYRLLGQARRNIDGARMTLRMVVMFVVLAVTPVLVVYSFSIKFLHEGIDSWFDVRVEDALEDALELGRTSLSGRMREYTRQATLMAQDLSIVPDELIPVSLDDPRRDSGASELALFTDKAHVIASSHAEATAILPERPDESVMLRLRQSGSYVGLDSIRDTGLHVRVLVPVGDPAPGSEKRFLQVLFPVSERQARLAENVQSAFGQYKELAYLRKPLKFSFMLTLSLVLLLSLGTAIWAAFFSAGRLVEPLRALAEGTRAVALGNYSKQLRQIGKNELGFLVTLFNDMTRKLAQARDEAGASQRLVEDQKTYLQAVLARMSSGMLTLDHDYQLVTYNESAERILGVSLRDCLGLTLENLTGKYTELGPLAEMVGKNLSISRDWGQEVGFFGPAGRQVLMCRGTPLAAADDPHSGHVIVFDDVTALIQAQRNAAWGEVARRLAHEIKNPLTPIQLSAERLRHKYMDKLTGKDADTLDRLTRTIVNQVESMKGMVNAFSDYARAPATQVRPTDLNSLVSDVVELYQNADARVQVLADLDAKVPMMEADPDRLRQVLHNLVKNAVEASNDAGDACVRVVTTLESGSDTPCVSMTVWDNGKGFPDEIVERVFEPYVTTKTKGSGLGLAIVKKIVEEHSGVVRVNSNHGGGTSIIVRFPITG